MEDIAQQTGIRVSVRGDLGDVHAQGFENMLLEDGLRRLLDAHTSIMRYEVDSEGGRRLIDIRVYAARSTIDDVHSGREFSAIATQWGLA